MSAPDDPISVRHMEAEHWALWSVALWGFDPPSRGGLTTTELDVCRSAASIAGRALTGSLDRLSSPELWPGRRRREA